MKKDLGWFILLLAVCLMAAEPGPGFIKTVTDPINKRQYSNIKSDSLPVVFYEVIYDRDLVYDSPEKNAETKAYLSKNNLVEFLKKDDEKNYYLIRMLNESGSLAEGWVRRKSLSKEKYYGRSLLSKPDTLLIKLKKSAEENEINPHWVMNNKTAVYADSLMTVPLTEFSRGAQIFVHGVFASATKICYQVGRYHYKTGFVRSDMLSPFALLADENNIDELLEDYDPAVLENDLVKTGFVNYLVLQTAGDYREEYVEDKLCRQRKGDTISYKQSFSNDQTKINKFFIVKNSKNGTNFKSFRRLPDEKIKMGLDSIDSKVIELTYKPKTALISVDGIDEGYVENQVTRLTIIHLDKFKTDLVFHRQDDLYHWKFRWNKAESKYLTKNYKHVVKNKRLVRLNLDKEK